MFISYPRVRRAVIAPVVATVALLLASAPSHAAPVAPDAAAAAAPTITISGSCAVYGGGGHKYSMVGDATPDAAYAQLQMRATSGAAWTTGVSQSGIGTFYANGYDVITGKSSAQFRWKVTAGPVYYSPIITVTCDS